MVTSKLEDFRSVSLRIRVVNIVFSSILFMLSIVYPIEYFEIIDLKEKFGLIVRTDQIIFSFIETIMIGLNFTASVRLLHGAFKGKVRDCIAWIVVHLFFILFTFSLLVLGYYGRLIGVVELGLIVFCGFFSTFYICFEFFTVSMFINELRKQPVVIPIPV